MLIKFYRHPYLNPTQCKEKLEQLQNEFPEADIVSMETELCFYVDISKDGPELSAEHLSRLRWILSVSFQEEHLSRDSFLSKHSREKTTIIEIGPRLNFSTPFSTNAVSICQSIGLQQVERIEFSCRYLIYTDHPSFHIPKDLEDKIVDRLHDRMTQMRYEDVIETFQLDIQPEPWYQVDVLGLGRSALENVSQQLGLAFDDWDLNFYTEMFQHRLRRNPTSVECFDLAQSNSEHSRHWFFKGKLVVDGQPVTHSLFDLVIATQQYSNQNNVIRFSDNSSAISGFECSVLKPSATNKSSYFIREQEKRDIIFTAETHNFPTGVAPFPGATTGTGGRIRDVQAVGRGGHVIAGTAGYSFGNLNIPGYKLPWEDQSFVYPSNLALPIEVAVEASNGASDYGNKFGEPVINGFARSFGLRLPNGDRKEWVKPIMFSGGIGSINHQQITKEKPQPGMEVVKLGGPVYRIGVGGGSASSVRVHGDNKVELDFGAVQRGDAEMGQKLNRVIRGCLELNEENPIASIHDQGAGGNGNVLKELCEPAGAVVYTGSFQLGDPTISTLECWGAEYQESDAILVKPSRKKVLQEICLREKCPVSFVGEITGDGRMVLVEGNRDDKSQIKEGSVHPVNLDLECFLGKMPQKTFYLDRTTCISEPLKLPSDFTIRLALERVLRLPSVASKRYLTNKVDRSVTGLVAQQQCVGPLHTPLADVAVIAQSFFDTVGAATSIGEQPIKGILNPAVGARMSVAEAITNLMFAKISSLQDVKCSGNWMWAAKLPGEGAALYDACKAMSDLMAELGVAIDGGKDSLSMAARVGEETVKSPGTLVISTYAPCPDITATVTPDFKCNGGKGALIYVKIEKGEFRLGGTAFAQVFSQLGQDAPDVLHSKILRDAFVVTQKLINEKRINAGHDVSDGGFITTLLEMAFAGNCGLQINYKTDNKKVSYEEILFNEEVGWILEIEPDDVESVVNQYEFVGATCHVLGFSGPIGCDANIDILINNEEVLVEKMCVLRDAWEETSFRLERRQATVECVEQEAAGLSKRKSPPFKLTFNPNEASSISKPIATPPKVCVLREEGTNGDREMAAALFTAGFEVWDVQMTDFTRGSINLNDFKGLVFPGGFSYADVLGSARGWAAELLFDKELFAQLELFKTRSDTFTLGVCNGCQLMAILGLVAPSETLRRNTPSCQNGRSHQGVNLSPNLSGRYESRFTTVKIENSPAIMFKGMEGSILGVWVAHGEGRFEFKNSKIYEGIRSHRLVPLSYVDDKGNATTTYPFNPNGSPGGLAGLCSQDGRHLAIMPHPERAFLPWQWAWMPTAMKQTMKTSPWLRMFENAFKWCTEHS